MGFAPFGFVGCIYQHMEVGLFWATPYIHSNESTSVFLTLAIYSPSLSHHDKHSHVFLVCSFHHKFNVFKMVVDCLARMVSEV